MLIEINTKDSTSEAYKKARQSEPYFHNLEIENITEDEVMMKGGRHYNVGLMVALIIVTFVSLFAAPIGGWIFTILMVIIIIVYFLTRPHRKIKIKIEPNLGHEKAYLATVVLTSNYKIDNTSIYETKKYFNAV